MEETYCRSTMLGLEVDTSALERPHLILLTGDTPLRTVFIEKDALRIGRDPEANDVVLSSKRVSSVHCRIVRSQHRFELLDWGSSPRGSTNGTRLNGRLLKPREPVPLAHGDKIEIADQMVLFLWQGEQGGHSESLAIRIDREEVRSEAYRLLEELPGLTNQRASESPQSEGNTGI